MLELFFEIEFTLGAIGIIKQYAEAVDERAIQLEKDDSTIFTVSILWFDLKMVHIAEDIKSTSLQTIFVVLQKNALFSCQADAFCSMRTIVQFTFFTPANGFCFYIRFYTAAMKVKALLLACPCRPHASSAPESSIV